MKASLSVSYSESYHQEHGIVANYEYAANVLGTDKVYTDYAIVMRQGFGDYKTFNYQGANVYWYCNIFLSPEENV